MAVVHQSYGAAFYVGTFCPGGMCAHFAIYVGVCIEIIAMENDHLELHDFVNFRTVLLLLHLKMFVGLTESPALLSFVALSASPLVGLGLGRALHGVGRFGYPIL